MIAHVGQPLAAGRLGLAAAQDAVGEVQQLGRELVALRERRARASCPSDRQVVRRARSAYS